MRKNLLLVLVASTMMGVVAMPTAQVHARMPQMQAQEEEVVVPPRPGRADQSRGILWSYAALALILAAVFGANAIPSKRGHQD